MADYTFTISTGTSSGTVNSPLLEGQLLDSSMTQPAKDALGFIDADVDEDLLTVSFSIVLSGADETVLNNVVAAHDGDIVISEKAQATRVPGEQSTTSGAWEQIGASYTPQPLSPGRWQLSIASEVKLLNGANFSSGSPDRAGQFHLMMDTGSGPVEIAIVSWPFDQYHDWTFIGSAIFNAGAQPIFTIQGRILGVADTASIRRLSIILKRIAERD